MRVGDLMLEFKDGVWTATNSSGERQAVSGPPPPAPKATDEQAARLQQENDALRGEVNMLKFKVELLLDMVTLANLDCDKLETKIFKLEAE